MTRDEILAAVREGRSLQEADLYGANLQEADLREAVLRGAVLRLLLLREAVLAEAGHLSQENQNYLQQHAEELAG